MSKNDVSSEMQVVLRKLDDFVKKIEHDVLHYADPSMGLTRDQVHKDVLREVAYLIDSLMEDGTVETIVEMMLCAAEVESE